MINNNAIPYILGTYGEQEQLVKLTEEIADVLIMIEQITYAEGFEDDVRKIIDEKISRQLDRIKGVKV